MHKIIENTLQCNILVTIKQISGGGTKSRSRACQVPKSVRKARNLNLEEDKPCPGPSTMVLFCQLEDCPPETQWGPWGPWGECSKNCGGGKRKRKRKCNTVKRYGQPSTCPGKCKSNFVAWK